jgi:hypothetical protein
MPNRKFYTETNTLAYFAESTSDKGIFLTNFTFGRSIKMIFTTVINSVV